MTDELQQLIAEQQQDDTDFQRPEFRDSWSLANFGENYDLDRLQVISREPVSELRDRAELNRINAADAARQPEARERRHERERTYREDPEWAARKREQNREAHARRMSDPDRLARRRVRDREQKRRRNQWQS